MIDLVFALGLAASGTTAVAGDDDKPKTIFAKDSARAARMKIDDPATIICVRTLMTNSRTRYSKRCLTQDQWISVELEKDAQAQDMKMSAKGLNIQ